MGQTSETILALKPVTFHYKDGDTKKARGTPQFGLIAEDVAEVNPDLVVRDAGGEPLSVRYDQVNAMLLNEFLKEHKAFLEEQRTVEEQEKTIVEVKSNAAKQEATISELRKDMAVLTAQLKEQAAQIRQVSAQIEMKEHAPQIVSNSP